ASGVGVAAVYRAPAYVCVLFGGKRRLLHRGILAVLPLAGVAAILILLGFQRSEWLVSFEIVARAVQPGHDIAVFAKPYTPLSLGHAWELLNAALLVLPVPALLLLSAGR